MTQDTSDSLTTGRRSPIRLVALLLAGGSLALALLLRSEETPHQQAARFAATRPPSATARVSASAAGGCPNVSPAPGGGLLRALAPVEVTAGVHPYDVVVSPDGRNVYVADYGSESVSQYARDGETGALTPLSPEAVPAGAEPHSVAVSADGRNVYVADAGSDSVSQYARDPATGALSALSAAAVPAGTTPRSITLSPDGRNAYVANTGATEGSEEAVSQYRRDPRTGTLTALSPATVRAGMNPRFVTVSPDGKSVYVAAYGAGGLFAFTRNPSTGALEDRIGYELNARPFSIAVSPDGRNVYVADYDTGGVAQFARNAANGRLRTLVPARVPAGEETHSVVVSPDGVSVYATNATPLGSVSQYARNPQTGALSAIGAGAIEVGTEPTAIALDPAGRSAYVTNHRGADVSQYERTGVSALSTAGQRVHLFPPASAHGRVRLSGRVIPPLTAPISPVRVWQRVGCGRAVSVAATRPNARGYYAITLSDPRGARTAAYRTTTAVRASRSSHERFQASSLEKPVRLR